MKDPIFAKTRYHYDSYMDFWRIVELSGFRVCYTDEIDLNQDEVYITSPLNGELKPHVAHRKSILKHPQRARIVWWNLERPAHHEVKASVQDMLPYVDRVWFSDKSLVAQDPSNLIYAELGSHPDFPYPATSTDKQYDFAHISYVTPRREAVYNHLITKGFKMSISPLPKQRRDDLWHVRSMLNIHQNDLPICEPIRFAIAAGYRLPLITEVLATPYPLEHGKTCLMASYDDMYASSENWLREDIQHIGDALYKRLAVDFNFRQGVTEALGRSFH